MKGGFSASRQRLFLKKFWKRLCFSLVGIEMVFMVWGTLHAQEPDRGARFLEANAAFERQDFAHAARLYESLLEEGYQNGYLYYNLGNAYFRLNDLGSAIGNYLKAARHLPRDEDLRANLQYARSQTKDQKEASQPKTLRQVLEAWSDFLTLQEWLGGLVVFNGVFWGVGLLRLFYRREVFAWAMFLAGGLALFFAVGATTRRLAPLPVGTILPQQSAIYSAPHSHSTLLFELHAGTEVIVEEEANQWAKIQFEPTRKGWIPKKELFLVVPHP